MIRRSPVVVIILWQSCSGPDGSGNSRLEEVSLRRFHVIQRRSLQLLAAFSSSHDRDMQDYSGSCLYNSLYSTSREHKSLLLS